MIRAKVILLRMITRNMFRTAPNVTLVFTHALRVAKTSTQNSIKLLRTISFKIRDPCAILDMLMVPQ